MLTRFVCLANSFKEGGRCLAGIVLDNNNKPVIENALPKWIRPVSNTPHGVVPVELVTEVEVPDIIEIEITDPIPDGYQSENVLFNFDSIKIVGKLPHADLIHFCEDAKMIFENTRKAIHETKIGFLTYSLIFICVDKFEVTESKKFGKLKRRLVFAYNGHAYDLPITDPLFLYHYQTDSTFLKNADKLFLTLSMSVPFSDGFCYKLVACILTDKN